MVEAHPWNEKLDLSHEAMDHEHHLQIAILTAFADAVEQRRPWLARRLAEQLVRYSMVHFGSEELLMEASAYPQRDAHASEHASFLVRMQELGSADDATEEVSDATLAAAIELREALESHIQNADRRLVAERRR